MSTLLKGLETWAALSERAPRTVAEYRWKLGILARAGIVTAEDAQRERVLSWVVTRRQERGVKPQTINSAVAALRASLSGLVAVGAAPAESVARLKGVHIAVRKPKRYTAVHRDESELTWLFLFCRDRQPRVLLPAQVAGWAGLRAAEVARMHTDEILPDHSIWVRHLEELGQAGRTKSGNERKVPIREELRAVLLPEVERVRALGGGYLFPSEPPSGKGPQPHHPFIRAKTLGLMLRGALAGTDLEGTTWRILRHSAASTWSQGDCLMDKIALWLGHDDPEVTSRYYAALKPGYDPDVERKPAA